jgi:hypothetical protein
MRTGHARVPVGCGVKRKSVECSIKRSAFVLFIDSALRSREGMRWYSFMPLSAAHSGDEGNGDFQESRVVSESSSS